MWYLLSPVGLLIYYVVVWRCATRTLRQMASVVTRYHPPAGLSSAAVRYVWIDGDGVWSGGADARSLAALLVDLAFRKQLSIRTDGGKYVLQRTLASDSASLADEEAAIITVLLPTSQPFAIEFLERDPYTPTRSAIEKALWNNLHDKYFSGNIRYRVVGVATMLLWAFVICLLDAPQWRSNTLTVVVALLGAGVAVGTFLIDKLRKAPNLGAAGAWLRPLAPYLVSAGLGVIGIAVFSQMANEAFAFSAIAMLVLNLAFGVLLRAPTSVGRQTLDEIAGYREFLQSVERLRLDPMTAADQPFMAGLDEHLGYVIALDVRDHWGDKLTKAIDDVLRKEDRCPSSTLRAVAE